MRILKILSVLFLLHALKYSYAQNDKHYEQVVRGVVVNKK